MVLMADSADALHAKCQSALVSFLSADLDLAYATLNSIRKTSSPDRCRSILAEVRASLKTIRMLEGRVEVPEIWGRVHDRTDELEAALGRQENTLQRAAPS